MKVTIERKGILNFSMEYGSYLGLYFIVKFLLATLSLRFAICDVLSALMLVGIPFVLYYLMIRFRRQNKKTLSLKDVLLNIRSHQTFNDLLIWEKISFLYQSSIKAAGDNPNEATQEAIANIAEAKEKVELELQKNQMLLDTSTGIKVKINPGYSIG